MKKLFLCLTCLILLGCGSSRRVKLTGCDHPSGWCNEIRDLSAKSWKYAQLSKNVYNDPFKYDVSNWFEEIQTFENKDLDFYAVLFIDKITEEPVLVFRGTDSARDFVTGNNPFKQKQNDHALAIYDKLKEKYTDKDFIVAGHSLGGGIAIHISLNKEKVTAFSFNGSPVFRNRKKIENIRYSIVENGEILKAVRAPGREAKQLYTSIGCSKGDPIAQHDMQKLATCLTQIGATEDKSAKTSLNINKLEDKYSDKN